MSISLKDALPTKVSLKSTCDTLDNCLKGTTPDDSLAVTGNLMLNRVKMDELISTLDKILSYNDSVYSELDGIMNACGGLVDFGNCKDMLEDAYQKIKRMEALKLELSEYASKTEELDSDLCSLYQEIWQEYGDDIRALIESGEGEGILEIQKILEMDAGEWSDKQAEQVANMLEHAFQQDNVELIDMCMEYFLKENAFKENNKTGYIVQLDEAAITKITNALERQGKVGETFYTLNRLKHYQYFQEKNGEKLSCMHSVSLVDGKIQITFDIQNRNKNEILDTISFTSQNLKEEIQYTTELQKLGFSADDIEQMRRNTYSDGDIEFLDMLLQKDYERAFEYEIVKCSSFTGINIVSYLMNLEDNKNCDEQLKIINTILYNKEYDNTISQGTFPEESGRGEYIDLVLSTFNQDMVLTQAYAMQNYKNIQKDELKEQYDYESELYRQSSLWTAIKRIYTADYHEFDRDNKLNVSSILGDSMATEYGYAQINSLDYDGNGYKFDFSLYYREFDFENETTYITQRDNAKFSCNLGIIQGLDISLFLEEKEISNKKHELYMLPIKTGYDLVVGTLTAGIAGSDNIIAALEGGLQKDSQKVVHNVLSVPYSKYWKNLEKCDIPIQSVKTITDAVFKYKKLQAEIVELNSKEQLMMMGKLSTFSMGFDCDMPIETQRVEAQLQNQGQTVVSIVRSNLLLEEDGLKYYFEDVCEGITEREIGNAI